MRYWKRVDENGMTTTVESYSYDLDVEGVVEISQAEYDAFIASLPPIPEPEPSPDIIRAREILSNPPTVITQVEMWELVRIYARLLGIE